MKGSILLRTACKHPYWEIHWYHAPHKKKYRIARYLDGTVFYQTHPDKQRDQGYRQASKLLGEMQVDTERGVFRIEKFTERRTDVIPYLLYWLDVRKPTLTPGGYQKYHIAVHKHIVPFFEQNPLMLHEIQYDTLIALANSVPGTGKTKKNVVDTLTCCLRFAKKAKRIPEMPEAPEKSLYKIRKPAIVWLPSDRQEAVIRTIPKEHQPIFWFLKYHLRRPGEAIALRKEDYDPGLDCFIMRRGISANKEIERTKTGEEVMVPCVSTFKPIMKSMPPTFSPYMFTWSGSHTEGQRYTHKVLRRIWDEACAELGEDITLYSGTKRSTASQLMNEKGLSRSELQEAGSWASIQSTEAYASANLALKRDLLERKVISISEKRKKAK